MTEIESTAPLLYGSVKSRCHTSGTSTKEICILKVWTKDRQTSYKNHPNTLRTMRNDTSRDQTSMPLQESQATAHQRSRTGETRVEGIEKRYARDASGL